MPASRSKPKITERISVKDFYDSYKEPLKLNLVTGKNGLNKFIKEKSINRPSLALTGFLKFFAAKRIQLFGAGEMGYLRDLSKKNQYDILEKIANKNIPCIIVSRNLIPLKSIVEISNKFNIPLMRTTLATKYITTSATVLLEKKFAPQVTEHGTLMDIKGIGTLLRGPSGTGKSECALALINHGYSLISDDTVYVKLLGENELMGTGPELNRGYMECRGLGIVSIVELFGVRAIGIQKKIDLVVTLGEWSPGMDEDRTGLEKEYYDILGKKVPHIILPVRPGRDLARLVEVAAMNHALKLIGHDSAHEFNNRLINHMKSKGK